MRINHGGNSGMYFRTAFGPGFPKGYEAQVDNTHKDPVRTGSLYNFVKVFEQLIPDDTWWTQHVIVEGNHIQIFVNDKKTVDFIDEKNTYTNGYLALQQHNAGSVVEFKNLMMKTLPPPEIAAGRNLAVESRTIEVQRGRTAHEAGNPDSRRAQRAFAINPRARRRTGKSTAQIISRGWTATTIA